MLSDIFLFMLAFLFFTKVSKRKPNRIVFASDAAKAPKGNLLLVLNEVRRRFGDSLDIFVSTRPTVYAHRSLRGALQLGHRIATARVLVLDDYFPEIYRLHMPEGIEVIQLWHASGAFKKVGFARRGMLGGPGPRSKAHRGYTAAIVSSEGVRDAYALAFNMPVENIHAVGNPKTDRLFDAKWVSDSRSTVRRELGIPADATVALVATTFRGHGQISAEIVDHPTDWHAIAEQLPGHYILIKNHPFTRGQAPGYAPHPRVIDVTDRDEFEPILSAADVLVSDYSSVIFDAALLGKPVVYFTTDQSDYEELRGFFFDADSYVWGPKVSDQKDLAAAIANPVVDKTKFDAAYSRHLAACDGHSTERVVDQLIAPFVEPSQ
ncbi:MAG: hypothetical protein RLZZ40_271 [Actinomycetota bacterium]